MTKKDYRYWNSILNVGKPKRRKNKVSGLQPAPSPPHRNRFEDQGGSPLRCPTGGASQHRNASSSAGKSGRGAHREWTIAARSSEQPAVHAGEWLGLHAMVCGSLCRMQCKRSQHRVWPPLPNSLEGCLQNCLIPEITSTRWVEHANSRCSAGSGGHRRGPHAWRRFGTRDRAHYHDPVSRPIARVP